VVTTDSYLSLIPLVEPSTSISDQGNYGQVFCIFTAPNDGAWIIDFRAINNMTFDLNDFSNITQPRRTCIGNANGVTYLVIGAGTNKLISMSQATKELNCVVLLYYLPSP
jgi:hypothetical protein